jgi:hypothetical protein
MIDVNLITTKNITIVTLHLDDEERGSEQLAPYGEFHRDNASSLHHIVPTPLSIMSVLTTSSSYLPSFLKMEYGIRLTTAPPSTSIREICLPSM